MSYEKIDTVIHNWAEEHSLVIFKEKSSKERRYFHASSSKSETFQIVIEPEANNIVRIDGHLIESSSEANVHYIWEMPVEQLSMALDVCYDTIQAWFEKFN